MTGLDPKAYGLPAGATIELQVEPECDVMPEDSFGYETEEENREAAEYVRSELASGNDYAWCWVRVVVRYAGHEGDDSIGACSYTDERDLMTNGPVADLVMGAWYEIKRKRVATRKALRTLGVRL